jgi:serine/threonine protein kinase
MAPEQAKGKTVDRRADIWAFGCVLYEMLTGRRAFDGDDTTEILGSIVKIDPDWTAIPASTPPSLRKLLKRCLAKDRLQRCHLMARASQRTPCRRPMEKTSSSST